MAGPPENVRVSAVNTTWLTVQWEPSRGIRPGAVFRYNVAYAFANYTLSVDSQDLPTALPHYHVKRLPPSASSTTLTGLHANTKYVLWMWATSDFGSGLTKGIPSAPLVIYTRSEESNSDGGHAGRTRLQPTAGEQEKLT